MATGSGGRSRLRGAGTGLVLAAALWLVLGGLGVPAMLGMGTIGDLPWIALAGLALGALGLAALLYALLATAVILVVVAAFFPIFDGRMAASVRSDSLGGAPVDAVIVLSGSLSPEGRIGNEAVERLVAGTALRQELGAPALLLTTVRRAVGRDSVGSERDQRALVARLDPGAEVFFVGPVRNTHDEAVAGAGIAGQRGWKRVAVVTSPFHTRRACASFEAQGLSVFCRPSSSRDYSLNLRRPPGERLAAFRDWVYEVAGTRMYRSRGWLTKRANRKAAALR